MLMDHFHNKVVRPEGGISRRHVGGVQVLSSIVCPCTMLKVTTGHRSPCHETRVQIWCVIYFNG
jgi:hypothetical protein